MKRWAPDEACSRPPLPFWRLRVELVQTPKLARRNGPRGFSARRSRRYQAPSHTTPNDSSSPVGLLHQCPGCTTGSGPARREIHAGPLWCLLSLGALVGGVRHYLPRHVLAVLLGPEQSPTV